MCSPKYGPDGTITAALPMAYAHIHRVSVMLQDGRVLVARGLTAGASATNTAETYDPVANSWTSIGLGMTEARFGTMAAVLQGGQTLREKEN